ncbi:MAG TPA: alpha/beta fold hydrolase [Kofleriaceae bacterium]|jgi:alpha-beta hydrolase superfamily lysophospholipase
MTSILRRAARIAAYALGLAAFGVLTILVYQAWSAQSLPDLEPWHRWAPPAEGKARDLDPKVTLEDYLAREERVFAELRAEIEDKLPPAAQTLGNRYWRDSISHAARFAQDWNRSYRIAPAVQRCGALMVHGLTDSPYSMRSLARVFADEGCTVVALRMPGHGTTPRGLIEADWEDWAAAVRVGWRWLAASVPAGQPLFLVGYSNGGALVIDAALDLERSPESRRPAGIVVLSPMIGIDAPADIARFAGALGVVPGLEKARWQSVLPEYNPFKYQSFPMHPAGETARLTRRVANRLAGAGTALPPLLAFQSAADTTVSASAVVEDLFTALPDGSDLVLYDVSRRSDLRPFFASYPDSVLEAARTAPARRYRLTIIGTTDPASTEVAARTWAPGESAPSLEHLGLSWPPQVYSLSHVALPFPPDDPLYGSSPDVTVGDGVHLGVMAPRGEKGLLIVAPEQWTRLSYNPFWSDLERRLRAWLAARLAA